MRLPLSRNAHRTARQGLGLVLALGLAACGDPTAPEATPAPESPVAPPVESPAEPPVEPKAAEPRVDAQEVRAALLADLGDSLPASDDGLPEARFAFRAVELNGDESPEVLAYLLGPEVCGTGGCDLKLLERQDGTLVVRQTFPITQAPVGLGPAAESGWRDLWRTEAGGGAAMSRVLHRFDGSTYVEVERTSAAPEDVEVVLGEDVTYDAGLPLRDGG